MSLYAECGLVRREEFCGVHVAWVGTEAGTKKLIDGVVEDLLRMPRMPTCFVAFDASGVQLSGVSRANGEFFCVCFVWYYVGLFWVFYDFSVVGTQ